MHIILTALDLPLYDAWLEECRFPDQQYIDIIQGSILDVECDAVVSPANSYGIMDGGIDKLYSQAFPGIQQRVQAEIEQYGLPGDPPGLTAHVLHWRMNGLLPDHWLPVGRAVVAETGVENPRYLIAAPTMEWPQELPADSDNAYQATKAALEIADPSWTIAFPGMGTGVGKLDPVSCARQVAQAIREQNEKD